MEEVAMFNKAIPVIRIDNLRNALNGTAGAAERDAFMEAYRQLLLDEDEDYNAIFE